MFLGYLVLPPEGRGGRFCGVSGKVGVRMVAVRDTTFGGLARRVTRITRLMNFVTSGTVRGAREEGVRPILAGSSMAEVLNVDGQALRHLHSAGYVRCVVMHKRYECGVRAVRGLLRRQAVAGRA